MLLDGPTWLSMVHELWEQDGALQNTACTQETLCRMNRLAMAAPGQAGWAVSLSRFVHKFSFTFLKRNNYIISYIAACLWAIYSTLVTTEDSAPTWMLPSWAGRASTVPSCSAVAHVSTENFRVSTNTTDSSEPLQIIPNTIRPRKIRHCTPTCLFISSFFKKIYLIYIPSRKPTSDCW